MTHDTSPIAHAIPDDSGNWRLHPLDEHLQAVAGLAARFATPFGASAWAELAGRWHDLGKYRPPFQRYIRAVTGLEARNAHIEGRPGRAPHSTAGALWAIERLGPLGRVLAYLIASHHAGLHDWSGGLEARLDEENGRTELAESLAQHPPPDILDTRGFQPNLNAIPGGRDGFALWVRMLFSCLVDADFLDTEAFMDPGKAQRRGIPTNLSCLLVRFDRAMAELTADADPTPVNRLRAEILHACRTMAAEAPGLFSLTVPTGGGKTLASMAFALEHARRFGKRRILYVIPYTSIIEQTADVFRSIFGEAVIEHHSNAESRPEDETQRSRLACENWDAPIIVTTSVQFFESLFAARTSRCRKLHNLVDSVVVIDEAQLLPPAFLQPILGVLKLLTQHYGVSIVLSTATQPALASRQYVDPQRNLNGLEDVREIIPDPDALYRQLKRVEVRLPADWHSPESWESLAQRLMEHASVLAIVNTRRHARELFRLMPPDTLHLSALLCGAHRSRIIAEIKARLKAGTPTRVISTQLVEAGVDLDFPVVYRALAGLDSIAQAAGRCNREGRAERGEVVIFVPPHGRLPDMVKRGIDATIGTLHGESRDPLDRALFDRYFERLYHACDLDEQRIGELLTVDGRSLAINFQTAAKRFRLIQDEDSAPVIVLYPGPDGAGATIDVLLRTLRKDGPERWLMRKLQRYTVNIPRREALRLMGQGDLEEVIPGLFVQVSDTLYDARLGLLPEGADSGAILMV
ncbi:CRISPR-associated helicase Cas3' [Thiocystis violacea]|uniref:CRISPR-associated helicase Cas3' n=1 Tax=Thiocystis violacea TaxID=13725 RepID=UPI001908437D|nr:CRISPR-associated helicase Cas3' [Thiocystis violacea]MBK1718605.1 CRISPR-associated helicase/endonuclease Cas3 [Thiocystis violacea]